MWQWKQNKTTEQLHEKSESENSPESSSADGDRGLDRNRQVKMDDSEKCEIVEANNNTAKFQNIIYY